MAQPRPLPEQDVHSDEDTLGVGLTVSLATNAVDLGTGLLPGLLALEVDGERWSRAECRRTVL